MIVCLLLTIVGWSGRQYVLQQQLAKKVLRFHVLANSDTIEDQTLKLEVRDAIGAWMQKQMSVLESKTACETFVLAQIPEIEQVAKQVVTEAGYAYEVRAELSRCYFPVKTYGDYTFPEGKYDALKVTLGAGTGQNWWCVMYPNMCFENSMYEVVNENSEKALRAVLSEEEYQKVLNTGNFEVRFGFLEWFH